MFGLGVVPVVSYGFTSPYKYRTTFEYLLIYSVFCQASYLLLAPLSAKIRIIIKQRWYSKILPQPSSAIMCDVSYCICIYNRVNISCNTLSTYGWSPKKWKDFVKTRSVNKILIMMSWPQIGERTGFNLQTTLNKLLHL